MRNRQRKYTAPTVATTLMVAIAATVLAQGRRHVVVVVGGTVHEGRIAVLGQTFGGSRVGAAHVWSALSPAPCPGDLDGDGDRDLDDLTLLLQDFGCSGGGCSGDIDGDGDTDLDDLTLLLQAFGNMCS